MKKLKPGFFVPDIDEARERQYLDDFGNFAMGARKRCNLTFRAAAEEIGITAAYLSDIEKGKEKPPTIKVLDSMITAYNLKEGQAKEFIELAARARGTLSLTLVNLFNGFPAARHIAYAIANYCDYLEGKQGVIDDDVTNEELKKLGQVVDEYINNIMGEDEE